MAEERKFRGRGGGALNAAQGSTSVELRYRCHSAADRGTICGCEVLRDTTYVDESCAAGPLDPHDDDIDCSGVVAVSVERRSARRPRYRHRFTTDGAGQQRGDLFSHSH